MTDRKRNIICCVLLFISLVFLVWGSARGEVETVENKSTSICMECIGIG